MKTVEASELEAQCLAIVDEVAATGEQVTIVGPRGEAVARLVPAVTGRARFPQRQLAGTVDFLGDVIAPAWETDE